MEGTGGTTQSLHDGRESRKGFARVKGFRALKTDLTGDHPGVEDFLSVEG